MPMAYGVPSDELLVGRARVTRLLEQGLAFARVGAGSKHACWAPRWVPMTPTSWAFGMGSGSSAP